MLLSVCNSTRLEVKLDRRRTPRRIPWHFSVFITNWFIVVYKHVIGLKTDVSQSNLGGNTDSNHLIPGEEWAFFIRLAQPSSRTACNTHFFLLFPGIGCRLFFVLCPSLYLGPCFYSAGCYPAFSYVFSPASDAGVLPPLWRGKVLPFTVQSRDHLATITDIYVPSFLRPVRGSLAPRLLLSIPRHWMPAFILSIPPFDGSRWSSLSRVV